MVDVLQMVALKEIEAKLVETGETQISLTDPDARSMMSRGSDRDRLSAMAGKARIVIGTTERTALSDRGYFSGKEILACHDAGMSPRCLRRKPRTPKLT